MIRTDNNNLNSTRLADLGRRVHLFVAKGPVYHYTYGSWRLKRLLARRALQTTGWPDETFLAGFDLAEPKLSQVQQAAAEKKYEEAKINLWHYFRTRQAPQFSFGPEEVALITALVDTRQQETTLQAADRICQNIFCFRRVDPVQFSDGIDWTYRPGGNLDWMWDLNRQTYFETLGRAYCYTGDERYAQKFRELLLDWLAKNPAEISQPNWASVFEVAFRVNTWLWAFAYFRGAAAFDMETCLAFLKGLLRHGHYLDAYIELHVVNNHLLLEAKALAMLGLFFPEYKPAEKWRQRGLRIVYEQVRAQIGPDGVHGELATFYHRVIGGELLELFVLLENNHVPVPADIVEAFNRMVEFELWITKPDGVIPLLNDSALEETYPRFSAIRGGPALLERSDLGSVAPPLDEPTIWLLGPERSRQYLKAPVAAFCLGSRPFPVGGYFVMRQGQDPEAPYLVFDGGPFGYNPLPSHGHADALSFELYAYGRTLVVDPGVYGTGLGKEWRNFFRSSRAHNTVVVDDQDQSILVDTWRVYRPAQTTLHRWLSSDHFDFVDASHNGYERLPEPVTHRRQVFFVKPAYWVIIDTLAGRGNHCFDLYFHLGTGMASRLEPKSSVLWAENGGESALLIAPWSTGALQAEVITGTTTAPIQGWVSFFSGEKHPAPVVRYRQVAVPPVQFCTVLYPYQAGAAASVIVSPLDIQLESDRSSGELKVTGLQIETDACIDYLVVDQEPGGRAKIFAGYKSDAQLTYLRRKKDNKLLVKAIIRGGDQLVFQNRPILVAASLAKDFIFDGETN